MKAEQVNKLFREKKLTLGSVESFTGGLFAETITSISGASQFFKGSIVTYATEEKVRLLGIPQELVDEKGVVSREVAFKMANNGKHRLNVDVCVSFTGNAGPEAMEGKPVGEVYIGIIFNGTCEVHRLNLIGTRKEIQQQAVDFALEKLLEKI